MRDRRNVFVVVGVVLCVAVGAASAASKLQEVFNWRQLDFQFPSQQMKQQALADGSYIPTNALPVGIEHWENKLFVSVPRWKDGTWIAKGWSAKGRSFARCFEGAGRVFGYRRSGRTICFGCDLL